jgi:hypothetical protein
MKQVYAIKPLRQAKVPTAFIPDAKGSRRFFACGHNAVIH